MDKQSLLETMHTGRRIWEQFLMSIDEQHLTQPNVVESWSIKDVMAHVTVWETWAANLIKSAIDGREATSSELFGAEISPAVDALELDPFNEWMVEQSAAKSLQEVHAASQAAFQYLVEVVDETSDEDLTDTERRFVGLEWKGSQPLWDMIANQTYRHYELHAASIRSWLETLRA